MPDQLMLGRANMCMHFDGPGETLASGDRVRGFKYFTVGKCPNPKEHKTEQKEIKIVLKALKKFNLKSAR